jgi:hypothetical protein
MPWTSENENPAAPNAHQNLAVVRHDLPAATDNPAAATTRTAYRGFIVGAFINVSATPPTATWDFTLTDALGRTLLPIDTIDGTDQGTVDVQADIANDPIPVVGPITIDASGMGGTHTGVSFTLLILQVP